MIKRFLEAEISSVLERARSFEHIINNAGVVYDQGMIVRAKTLHNSEMTVGGFALQFSCDDDCQTVKVRQSQKSLLDL